MVWQRGVRHLPPGRPSFRIRFSPARSPAPAVRSLIRRRDHGDNKLEGQRKYRVQPARSDMPIQSCQSSRIHARILVTAFWTSPGTTGRVDMTTGPAPRFNSMRDFDRQNCLSPDKETSMIRRVCFVLGLVSILGSAACGGQQSAAGKTRRPGRAVRPAKTRQPGKGRGGWVGRCGRARRGSPARRGGRARRRCGRAVWWARRRGRPRWRKRDGPTTPVFIADAVTVRPAADDWSGHPHRARGDPVDRRHRRNADLGRRTIHGQRFLPTPSQRPRRSPSSPSPAWRRPRWGRVTDSNRMVSPSQRRSSSPPRSPRQGVSRFQHLDDRPGLPGLQRTLELGRRADPRHHRQHRSASPPRTSATGRRSRAIRSPR